MDTLHVLKYFSISETLVPYLKIFSDGKLCRINVLNTICKLTAIERNQAMILKVLLCSLVLDFAGHTII